MVLGWISAFGWGTEMVNTLSSLYIGYNSGILGGLIGAVWGFADGALGGVVIALIYNAVTKEK